MQKIRVLAALLAGCALAARGQTPKQASTSTAAPLAANGEDATSAGIAPPGLPAPPADARDFEGDWYPFQAPAPGGAKGPPPGNAGGDNTGGSAGGAKRAASIFDNNENAPNSFELCASQPLFLGTMGVAIVQSPTTLMVANEETGNYRLIRIGGVHPHHFTPTRKGDSVAHWDGNTLVVDVVGFTIQNGSASDAHVTEHLFKDQNNTRLNDVIDVFYPSTGRHETRSTTYRWRPDLTVSEEVCEEGYSAFEIKNGKLVIKADQ